MGDAEDTCSILETFNKVDCVKFLLWCAEKALPFLVEDFPDVGKPQLAIQAIKNWIADPSEENLKLTLDAGEAVIDFSTENCHVMKHIHATWAIADTAYFVTLDKYSLITVLYVPRLIAKLFNDERSSKDILDEYLRSIDTNSISLFELNHGF